jgi:hypothetical protein
MTPQALLLVLKSVYRALKGALLQVERAIEDLEKRPS